LRECKFDIPEAPWKCQTVFVEEEEDEFWKDFNALEKSEKHLLYKEGDEDDKTQKKEALSTHKVTVFLANPNSNHQHSVSSQKEPVWEQPTPPSARPEETKDPPMIDTTIPPPTKENHFRLPKRRSRPEGTSAVGISVQSTKGFIGGLTNAETDLHLDLCADITLISQEFHESLPAKPSIKQGMRMQLWQLMDKDLKLKGFVCIPIFMVVETGDILETEAEVYIVPNMMVPILLGEDYQQSYEISITQNMELRTYIGFVYG